MNLKQNFIHFTIFIYLTLNINKMLRQIRLDKYPKKSQSFRPEILNPLLLLQRQPYDINTHKFLIHDNQYEMDYQLYVTKKLNKQVQQNIQFIQHVPNILILQNQPHSLIVQQQYKQTLKQYMSFRQNQRGLPFLNEIQTKQIILDLLKAIESFQKNNINYQTLHDHNIVRFKSRWTLSLAAVLSNSYLLDKNFFDAKRKGREGVVYALGSLIFKMLFGFVPYQQNAKKPSQFKFVTYINHLEQQNNKKMLKIYYFADRIQMISNTCKQLIQQCLSGKILSLETFQKHAFFTSPPQSPKKQVIQNRQIRMISCFQKRHHSLIMASIQRRKKNPYQKLHQKQQNDVSGFLQLRQMYSKDIFLCHLHFAPIKTQSELKRVQQSYDNLKIQCNYFERQFEFGQGQRPTLQLIKLIDKDRTKYPDIYQKQDRQSKIKLYVFPYVMVFELANVYHDQSVEVKKKIQQLIPLLLQVSSMHWPVDKFVCLHNTPQKKTRFQDLKLRYRELINALYKTFLMQAMKRYNAKKQNLTISQKIRLKQQGLQYYRLCLKLMQVSLIVRKGGKDLDLQRIETSQRKQIQQDLQVILKTYFPNRVEIR